MELCEVKTEVENVNAEVAELLLRLGEEFAAVYKFVGVVDVTDNVTVLRLVAEGINVVDWRVDDVGLYWGVDTAPTLALIEIAVRVTSELL